MYAHQKLFRFVHPPTQIIFRYSQKCAEYKKYCEVLRVSEESDKKEIKIAYLNLAKKYHPDNPEGDSVKFQEVDLAFRFLINAKIHEERNLKSAEEESDGEHDINKFKCAQHRQYLSYGGFGSGTPFQREKQYKKFRAVEAADNVLQHRIAKAAADDKTLMDKKVPFKHKIKTKYGFERLVEDLIQESMSKGEFKNLAGSGKPLSQNHNLNPYVDFVTYKLNQVLIDNGFMPEWILLQKEINEEIQILRNTLAGERLKLNKILSDEEVDKWNDLLNKFKKVESEINKKINKFNLVVPIMNKQMILIDLNNEANNIIKNGESKPKIFNDGQQIKSNSTQTDNKSSLFQLFRTIFKN